jgi:KDO2-lipid IV(A) lauroyltransferase
VTMELTKDRGERKEDLASLLPFYLFLLPLQTTARVLPWRPAQRLGVGIGELLYRGVRRYREVALRNLDSAFGWEACRTQTVARQSFRNIGKTLVEFLRLPTLSKEAIRSRFHLEGMEHLHAARAAGRGALLITAHYGNWEFFAARLVLEGIPCSVVAREADTAVTNGMIQRVREACGYRVIPRQSAPRGVLGALRQNEMVAMLIDQNTVRGGIFVPFLGRQAATAIGPAVFALRTGASVVPCFAVRQPDDTHVGRFLPPVALPQSGDRETDIRELTARLTAIIETQVRADPTQWFWIHDRWRHRPPEEGGNDSGRA